MSVNLRIQKTGVSSSGFKHIRLLTKMHRQCAIERLNASICRLEEELRSARQDAHEARTLAKELLDRNSELKQELRDLSKELRQARPCRCCRRCNGHRG